MRTILIDWLHEVAVLYQLPPPVLPSAVNLLDRCLSSFPIPRSKLQLAGCVCLLLESHRYRAYLTHIHTHTHGAEEGVDVAHGCVRVMTVENVVFISDGTYAGWEVVGMCRKVLLYTLGKGQGKTHTHAHRGEEGREMGLEEEGGQGNINDENDYLLTAQEEGGVHVDPEEALQQLLPLLADPAAFTFATTARGFLCTYLNEMVLKSLGSFHAPGDTHTHTHTDMEAEMVLDTDLKTVSEEVVFAHFLVDLALLDYGMLRFLPSTVAASVLFLTRLMMMHLAGVAHAQTHTDARGRRLGLGLLYSKTKEEKAEGGVSVCVSPPLPPSSPLSRPFVSPAAIYAQEPWGLPAVRVYLQSTPTEAHATALCVERLWNLLHDYHLHVFPPARGASPTAKDTHTHTHTHTHTRGAASTILKSHAYMFKGLQERYVNRGSARAAAWKEAGLVKREVVEGKIDEWLGVCV